MGIYGKSRVKYRCDLAFEEGTLVVDHRNTRKDRAGIEVTEFDEFKNQSNIMAIRGPVCCPRIQ